MDQMPIRAKPYVHQIEAYNLACSLCGLSEGGDRQISMRSNSCALLMEM